MIDREMKFVFVENPKTASFALKCALMGSNLADWREDPRIGTVSHLIPSLLRAKFPTEWASFFRFVVVRNTWDRALSFFRFYQTTAGAESYTKMSFDEWVEAGCPFPEEAHLRSFIRSHGRHDVLSQLPYVEDVDEVIILNSLDPEIRSGELQAGVDGVFAKLGQPSPHIPKDLNRSRPLVETFRWTRTTVERLHSRYAEEIERFRFIPPAVE